MFLLNPDFRIGAVTNYRLGSYPFTSLVYDELLLLRVIGWVGLGHKEGSEMLRVDIALRL